MTKLSAADYVHLHNHTQYSLLDGLTKVDKLIEFVVQQGMSAVAMTDHGTMSGTIEFYKEAINNEIKPIIGIETYVAARKHTDKDVSKDKKRYHLILLAMNNVGYQNLMRLSTIANLDGFYYYPRVDHELLEQYSEGIIVLSACMGGEIGDALKQDDYTKAFEVAQWYKQVFGDRYYLEVQDHGHPDNPLHSEEQYNVNKQILKLGKELDIPVVVTCDAHYLKHEDQEAHEILLCVGTGSFLADEKRMSLKEFPLHVTEPMEIIERWGTDHPEVILNSKAIADRCKVEINLGKILIPKFDVPKGKSEKTYLDDLVYKGLAWRYGGVPEIEANKLSIAEAKKTLPDVVAERAEYELGIIDQMGFNGYFLIIHDFINWGKNEGIVFGPGRGSAAGSIIAFSLKITELDPIKYDLLFERFLNPDRISMPDIDIDIQDTRRDEVIQYCVRKYGTERVANIVTFGRMFARNAVRDVSRVLQVPYAHADRLAKMIPPPVQGRHIPLETSLRENAELKAEYENNETSKMVLDQAVILEGTVRSHGIHAAGVVIAPDELVKFAPLEMAQKGVVSTQYPMGPIEELGLLKMDFLGLSNLTTIKNALRIIKRVYNEDVVIDDLPLDDTKTYELLQRGDTTGVFQLESSGMKRYLKDLKPSVFDDIVAMVALYRPGPMQFIDSFIKRKHGEEKIKYLHEGMENSLSSTYGILVYQEQFMQISKEWSGFTGGQADTLRKAVGKKKIDLMRKVKVDFVEGAIEHSGASRQIAEKFWNQLEEFANYCFNKSHAACYGLIAYWTAYLKAHYPDAFMAALMTSDYDDIDRLAIEITECKNMGIEVLPPDVQESFLEFAVVPGKNQIRFGLHAVKNVGNNAAEEILRARDVNGGFTTLEQFLSVVNVRIANRKTFESLIKAGGFDRFGERHILLGNLDLMLAYASKLQKAAASGQTDLFGTASNKDVKLTLALSDIVPPIDHREQLQWERDLLGLYLSQHPLDAYELLLSEQTVAIDSIKPEHDGKSAVVGGAVSDVREITTKNGQKMAFIRIADLTGEIELILFPSVYQQTIGIWERDNVLIIKGKVSAKDRDGNIGTEIKLMADEARPVTYEQASAYQSTGKKPKTIKASVKKTKAASRTSSEASSVAQRVYVRLESSSDQAKLLSLKQAIDAFPGDTEVVLVIGEKRQIIRLPGRIARETGVPALESAVGGEYVKVQ
ncbi:MAG: DNA polymerase III subunit alpha [Candidatus Saccharimonadales bacterium]